MQREKEVGREQDRSREAAQELERKVAREMMKQEEEAATFIRILEASVDQHHDTLVSKRQPLSLDLERRRADPTL